MEAKKYIHLKRCKCGKGGEQLEKIDTWWVDEPSYSNCFWVYLRHNDRQHTLNEVANLLNLSISAITATEKKAYKKLNRKLRLLNFTEKK